MTLITYLLRRFIPLFVATLGFFSFVLVLVDLLMNLWQYILHGVSVSQILSISAYYIPKAISFSAPIAILFTASFVLSSLYANNELTAIFSSGVSLFSFTLPILIFSFIASIGFFFFEDRVVVPTLQAKVEAHRNALNEVQSFDNNRLVILTDAGKTVYRADEYNDTQQTLYNVDIFLRDDSKVLEKVVRADSARWDGEKWVFNGAKTYTSTPEGFIYTTGSDYISTEIPDTFRNVYVSVEEVSVKEARDYINRLKRIGLPYAEESSLYHEKFSYSFAIFISVFLSIGLSGKSKKNVLLVSLALSVSAAVLFYVFQLVTMLMAKFSYIPPITGAWLPVIVFIGISIGLLRFART